jgi:hypothetical protein
VAYASAGGVTEAILDGVTGLLAADAADLTARVATLAAGCVLIRRKVRGIIGYDRRGSGHNGEDADDR